GSVWSTRDQVEEAADGGACEAALGPRLRDPRADDIDRRVAVRQVDAIVVLRLVGVDEVRKRVRVACRLGLPFEDDDVVAALEMDEDRRIARQVAPLLRLRRRAEPERLVEPEPPDR